MRFLLLIIGLAGATGCEYQFIGPTINNNNNNSNNNDNNNKIDLHDLINFVPSTNPTAPVPGPSGPETPLPVPTDAQTIAQRVADSNPALIAKSCPALFGESGWAFMDLVVKTLAASDARWGYLIKSNTGVASADVIAYRATSDNTGAWGIDIIVDLCGTSKFSWQVIGFDAAAQWSANR